MTSSLKRRIAALEARNPVDPVREVEITIIDRNGVPRERLRWDAAAGGYVTIPHDAAASNEIV